MQEKNKSQREAGSVTVLSIIPVITAALLIFVPSLGEPIKILLLGIALLTIALVGRRRSRRPSVLNAMTDADSWEDRKSDIRITESLPLSEGHRDSNSPNRPVLPPVLGNGHDSSIGEKNVQSTREPAIKNSGSKRSPVNQAQSENGSSNTNNTKTAETKDNVTVT